MKMDKRPLVLLCLILAAEPVLFARQEGPPPGPPPDMQSGPPPLQNVKKRLSQMTHRYDLSPAQQEALRPILESERQQMSDLRKDDSLAPQDIFPRVITIHKTANTRIETVLTDTQKARFEEDEAKMEEKQRQQMERMERMGPPGDLPPPPDGGPPN